jgi:hypothetical protein
MIKGTRLSELAQQLLSERQARDFITDTRQLTPCGVRLRGVPHDMVSVGGNMRMGVRQCVGGGLHLSRFNKIRAIDFAVNTEGLNLAIGLEIPRESPGVRPHMMGRR